MTKRNLRNISPLLSMLFILSCGGKESLASPLDSMSAEDIVLQYVEEIPRYYPEQISSFQVDLRLKDLSGVDLTGRRYDLLHSCFDNYTLWPESLPEGFDPKRILENNLGPGLMIARLHDRGITGKGVKIAIIDQFHRGRHNEFKDRITLYEDYTGDAPRDRDSLHGPAVSSLAAGLHTGVAPESEIIFLAASGVDKEGNRTCAPFISCLKEIGEYNRVNKDKIDVLSLSIGINPDDLLFDEYCAELKALEKTGLAVFSTNMFFRDRTHHFYGLEKDPLDDQDDTDSYRSIPWDDWLLKIRNIPGLSNQYQTYFTGLDSEVMTLLLPLDGSTVYAGYAAEDHYIYKFVSGWSWCPPYLAGLYALCRQIDPWISLDEFWRMAYETGKKYDFQANGKIIRGRIIRPVELCERISREQL